MFKDCGDISTPSHSVRRGVDETSIFGDLWDYDADEFTSEPGAVCFCGGNAEMGLSIVESENRENVMYFPHWVTCKGCGVSKNSLNRSP